MNRDFTSMLLSEANHSLSQRDAKDESPFINMLLGEANASLALKENTILPIKPHFHRQSETIVLGEAFNGYTKITSLSKKEKKTKKMLPGLAVDLSKKTESVSQESPK